ncbi:Histidine--tRNA ligase [Platanthera guangdongensis]|uniref:histidine--tRNA ligase n=1 Tax=Platanthera guangdongensis TaxID=2320717 RepID=A0ABR2LWK7_9ASPA
MVQLAVSVGFMSEISLDRTKSVVALLYSGELQKTIKEEFEEKCPSLDTVREELRFIIEKSYFGSDSVLVFHNVNELVKKFGKILSWEMVMSLYAIEMDDSVDKQEVGGGCSMKNGGESTKDEKKSEKKKRKKKTLGRGTAIVRQILMDWFRSTNDAAIDNVSALVQWAEQLSPCFDLDDAVLGAILEKIKEIVESNETRRLPKIPKGTRDFGKDQMAIRVRAFSIINKVFKRHGAVALDTPVFELRETLTGKYGEDSKLIYDLADQGGELCSLRYDLTVPFARHVAMNNISSLKRYQIAKVYRRDNPSKGRYREFYQCDFDIAGQYEVMQPDFEVIRVLTELLDELNIGDYEVKVNHRKLLDGMLEICGVPSEKLRTVCSSIDKLDKQSFEQVKRELVEEKGLAAEITDRIGSFVKKRGSPLELLSELKGMDSPFLGHSGSSSALNELELLFKALEKSKCLGKIVFDLSLARGLDYYTGMIFEAVFKGATQVGSIAAGGRYDNLVGMFSGKQVPAVGVSLGIERVFTIMEQLHKERNEVIRAMDTQVLVAILNKDLLLASELVSPLWDAKIETEFGLEKRARNYIDEAIKSGIPWVVFVGESELERGVLKLKNIKTHQEEDIPRERFVKEIQSRLLNNV